MPDVGWPNESLAGKAVVDWLNGRAKAYTGIDRATEVSADWTTGRVGMIGTSYNGTLPIGVASTGVEGLEAIVPVSAISSWYNYYRSDGAVRAPVATRVKTSTCWPTTCTPVRPGDLPAHHRRAPREPGPGDG